VSLDIVDTAQGWGRKKLDRKGKETMPDDGLLQTQNGSAEYRDLV